MLLNCGAKILYRGVGMEYIDDISRNSAANVSWCCICDTM